MIAHTCNFNYSGGRRSMSEVGPRQKCETLSKKKKDSNKKGWGAWLEW
jgi:hypothetical protein